MRCLSNVMCGSNTILYKLIIKKVNRQTLSTNNLEKIHNDTENIAPLPGITVPLHLKVIKIFRRFDSSIKKVQELTDYLYEYETKMNC